MDVWDGIKMLYEKERYKVSNFDGTVSVYVVASNPLEALDKVKELTEWEELKIAERVDE